MKSSLRVFLIAPHMSRTATGEGFVAFKWAEALSERVRLTVASLQSPKHEDLQKQLPKAEVITWAEPKLFKSTPRFRAMFKPEWFFFSWKVQGFLKDNTARFDISHQIMPQAMRYASPLRKYPTPYVIGPLGGSLTTPKAFILEAEKASWFTKLRELDRFRLKYDPGLRKSYSGAALILGVAPYIRTILSDIDLNRYENVLELGIDEIVPVQQKSANKPADQINLLHVGRGVRTKGLREVIRALAHLSDMPGVTLTSAGTGAEIENCRKEAEALGVADRVRFLGLIPRSQVETLYAEADIFVFPSFREPAGNVIYEAMRWGLPVIAAARGGPDWIVDENTGIKIAVNDPTQMARDVAGAIRTLALDTDLRNRLGAGARDKLRREGLWSIKADRLVEEYHETIKLMPIKGNPL